MKLYFSKGACSLAVRIIINELKIKSDYVSVNLKDKKTESGEDYLAINPKGSVPAIETEHGLLTENSVIQQYLSDTTPNSTLLAKIPDFKRYRTLEMLNYVSTEIHKGFGPLFNDKMPDDVKKDIAIPNLQKKFAFIDSHLEKNHYIMGNDFTLPDGYLFVVLRWAHQMKVDLSKNKNLDAYYKRLSERDAIKKSLQEEGISA